MDLSADDGDLLVHTGVAGAAARMGHDLVLRITEWSASVELDGTTPTAIRLRAHLPSIEVLSGSGGVKPLSGGDRATIVQNALKSLDAQAHPEVTFTSESLVAEGAAYRTSGELGIAGVTRTIEALLEVTPGPDSTHVSTSVPVRQGDFGVRPYSTMMGQLKVADEVRVTLSVDAPT